MESSVTRRYKSADVLINTRKTIYDIASRSGVSPATVSRYLNNTSNVSPAFRERIATVIKELDYHPSQAARALAGHRTGIVVLAVPNIDNPRWPEVARALESRLADAGLSLVLINLGTGRERELAGLQRVFRMRAEALVISMLTYEPGDFSQLQRAGTQVISVSNDIVDRDISAVLPDRRTGVQLAVQHLAGLGHQRLALIDGPARLPGVQARISAYRDACERASIALEPDLFVHMPEPTMASGDAFILNVLGTGATAVLATNDTWAIDLWMGLERLGLRVPADVSLVGMDDIPSARLVRTGLTTIALDREARGRAAADLLIERRADAMARPRQVLIPPRLVVRASTAPPAPNGRGGPNTNSYGMSGR
jgi:LacI family transcriptional regulator